MSTHPTDHTVAGVLSRSLQRLRAIILNNADSQGRDNGADRFGWQEEVDTVIRIVQQLPPEDRAQAAILCSNYGEAGALEFLGHDLPPC